MATHALPSSRVLVPDIIDDEIAPQAAASAREPASGPSLMRRLFDAMAETQMRRARREVDRVLGPGAFEAARRGTLPPR